jgi:hypothetical protein
LCTTFAVGLPRFAGLAKFGGDIFQAREQVKLDVAA